MLLGMFIDDVRYKFCAPTFFCFPLLPPPPSSKFSPTSRWSIRVEIPTLNATGGERASKPTFDRRDTTSRSSGAEGARLSKQPKPSFVRGESEPTWISGGTPGWGCSARSSTSPRRRRGTTRHDTSPTLSLPLSSAALSRAPGASPFANARSARFDDDDDCRSSCAGINGKGKKTKANAASSFGLAAEIACFQPPKPKVKVAPARQPSRESEQNKLKGKPAVVPSARKHREAEPSKSTGRPRAFAPRSREARASTPKAEPTQALPLEPIEESKALTPSGASLDSRGAAEARTPDISKTTATASDVERKVKLACDSTRKKRNRRKTVCFGDWVTCTPPPVSPHPRPSSLCPRL